MHICIHLRLRPENVVAQTPYLNPTGLYDPTKDKSILAVTYHLNRKQINFQPNHCISQSQTFTHRRFYTQTLLHTDHFTQRHFYTQRLLHTDAFTHRRICTQTLLQTDSFTHRHIYTDHFTHRPFYTQTILHTDTITHRTREIAILNSVFDVQRPFRAKGSRWIHQNRNFTSVFDAQCPFRAKGVRWIQQNRNFTAVFDVQRPFRAKGLRFVALRRHRPRLKREIERRARGDLQM